MYCNKCGKEIAKDSLFCNFCGASLNSIAPVIKENNLNSSSPKNKTFKTTILILALFAITIGLIANAAMKGAVTTEAAYNTDDSIVSSSKSNNSPLITLDEFCAIETEMTYDEVVEIIGSKGTELSRSKIEDFETVMIYWDGKGIKGANANVMFQNGKVISKAQVGLKN